MRLLLIRPVRPGVARAARRGSVALAGLAVVAAGLVGGPTAQAAPVPAAPVTGTGAHDRACAPAGYALSYSDRLDKIDVDGARVGGLSSLAYDQRRHAFATTVDNHADDPARIWFFRSLAAPRIVGDALVLRRPDGTPYDGTTADDEGLAVLANGDYVVTSETEPSIRVFGRDGVQKSSLPVPARFAVTGTTPVGEATANATLESLTLTPDGRHLIAVMEGALSGDVAADGDATLHRALVYTARGHGRHQTWRLQRQLAYRADPGLRIPEVAAYGRDGLLVMEAAFDPATGNTVKLFAVDDWRGAADVSDVANLSSAPDAAVGKRLVADLGACPTLGAPTKGTQANPLLDNYEAMAIVASAHGWLGVSVLSDDNFGATQTTRLLNLAIRVR